MSAQFNVLILIMFKQLYQRHMQAQYSSLNMTFPAIEWILIKWHASYRSCPAHSRVSQIGNSDHIMQSFEGLIHAAHNINDSWCTSLSSWYWALFYMHTKRQYPPIENICHCSFNFLRVFTWFRIGVSWKWTCQQPMARSRQRKCWFWSCLNLTVDSCVLQHNHPAKFPTHVRENNKRIRKTIISKTQTMCQVLA